MDKRAKMKKAAIMAVMAFLEEEEKNKKSGNNWVDSGRQMIMKNRQMAQTKLFR
ncbi:hypothetical protein [Thiospirochaeta perfilievii]|uniref:hypothetical protein n=1 Tax=Thiospirochaeta perfilievii TaxID=252967 RepID=UPI001659117E|nr:hypothetical protein [Thiospirochaeta perfilievii]